MSGNEFTLELKRSQADFFDVVRIISPRVWGWWRPLLNCGVIPFAAYMAGIAAGMWVLFGADGAGNAMDSATHAVIAAAIVTGAALILLQLMGSFALRPKFIAPDGDFLAAAKFQANEDGVVISQNHATRNYSWRAFRGIQKSKRGFYILIDQGDGIYIPRSSFPDNEIANAFEVFVNSKLNSLR